MARTEILNTVQRVTPEGDIKALPNASVLVLNRTDQTSAPVYVDEFTTSVLTQPLTTDSAGRIQGWLEPGKYILRISGSGLSTYDQPINTGSGADTPTIPTNALYHYLGPFNGTAGAAYNPGDVVVYDNKVYRTDQSFTLSGSNPPTPPNDSIHWAPIAVLGTQDFTAQINALDQKVNTKVALNSLNLGAIGIDYVVGSPIVVDAAVSRYAYLNAKNATAMQIGVPLNPGSNVFPMTFIFSNGTGGAISAPTFNSIFLLTGAFTPPANNNLRLISFYYEPTIQRWIETYRSPADIPFTPTVVQNPGSDTYASKILALPGLKGFWRMNATSGTAEVNIAPGAVGNALYSGIYTQAQPSLLGSGEVDKSASGNPSGAATWMTFGNTAFDFIDTGDFYIGALIKIPVTSVETDYRLVVGRMNAGETLGYSIKLNASTDGRGVNKVLYNLNTSGGPVSFISPSALVRGRVYYVAMERQGTTLRAILDGAEIGTATVSGGVGTLTTTLGSQFTGYLDEVYIGSGFLGATKHLDLYTTSKIANVPVDPAAPTAGAPTVTLAAVTTFAQTTASVNGTVDPNNAATTYQWELATAAFASSTVSGTLSPTTPSDAGAGPDPVPVSFNYTALTANTTYYFRLRATNSVGTSVSGQGTFTTSPVGIATDPPKNLTAINTATSTPQIQFDPPVTSVTSYLLALSNLPEGGVGRTTRYITVTATINATTGKATIPVERYDLSSNAAQTTYYGLRTSNDGSAWGWPPGQTTSGEVKIDWPLISTPVVVGGTTSPLRVGYGGYSSADLPIAKNYGGEIIRTSDAFFDDSPTNTASNVYQLVTAAWAAGLEPLVLANFPNDAFPSDAQCRNLGTWAAAFGPGGTVTKAKGIPDNLALHTIEFGNEQSYSYGGKAQTYLQPGVFAQKFEIAADAIAAANSAVGLACVVDGNNSNWIAGLKAAKPTLYTKVKSWILHPYGPTSRRDPIFQGASNGLANVGWPRPDASRPFCVSEWGISSDDGPTLSDNYGYPPGMTYAAVTAELKVAIPDMFAKWPIGPFTYYKIRDDRALHATTNREDYFGIVHPDGSAKGGIPGAIAGVYTTAKANRT